MLLQNSLKLFPKTELNRIDQIGTTITLGGCVLPIGGLKEKLLAAHREGIKTVIIPEENEADLRDIPDSVLQNLKVVKIEAVDDVLKNALVGNISKRNVVAKGDSCEGSGELINT